MDDICRVYALSWKTAYRGMIPDDYLDALSETKWTSHLSKDSDRLLLAIDHDKIVGVSTYSAARDSAMAGWGEIISLYLLPSYYRKGIGTKLLKAAIKELTDIGYRQLYLWVLEDNRSARSFYEQNGFIFSGDRQADQIGGKTVYELRYICCIK